MATLAGFNVIAGGGMGVTHNKEATFARLADVVGFVAPEHAVDVIKAIVTVHRDFGDRTDRKHARLKYVLHEWGLEKFRQELQSRVTFPIEPPREMPTFVVDDHLGWNQHGPDAWSLGLPIDSGRIADVGNQRIRTGIREVVSRFVAHVQLTAQQNILLSGIRDGGSRSRRSGARRPWHRHRRQDQRPAAQQPGLPGAAHMRPGHQRGRTRAAAGTRRDRRRCSRMSACRASPSCSA